MRKFAFLVFFTLCSTAATGGFLGIYLPNEVRVTQSDFDNATYVSAVAGFVFNKKGVFAGSPFSVGYYWNSNDSANVVLEVGVLGIVSIDKFRVRIGSDISEYSPISITEFDLHEVTDKSTQTFRMPLSVLAQMVEGPDTRLQLSVGRGDLLEGRFNIDKKSATIRGARKFLAKVAEK